MGLKILGRVGTQIFQFFFPEKKKKYNFIHFEKHLHKIIYFPGNLKKFEVSPVNLSRVVLP